jgi:hypothetical protein
MHLLSNHHNAIHYHPIDDVSITTQTDTTQHNTTQNCDQRTGIPDAQITSKYEHKAINEKEWNERL